MPDLSQYPVQGKLRIRQGDHEHVFEYLTAHAGYLSTPVLRSLPGYDFLKFWYADFAATPQQWAVLQPEMDKWNVLVTLYEAPVNYMEALSDEEEETAEPVKKPSSRLPLVYGGVALVLMLAALLLLLSTRIDLGACIIIGVGAALLALIGQIHGSIAERNSA